MIMKSFTHQKVRIDRIDNAGIINADTGLRTHQLRIIKDTFNKNSLLSDDSRLSLYQLYTGYFFRKCVRRNI